MNLVYLGDALDHWKGALFESLEAANILEAFAVDAMASDGSNWLPVDWALYARLLHVQGSQLVVHENRLLENRKQYFGEIAHKGDLFLDPDTGIATSAPGAKAPQYIMPAELVGLLDINRARIVAVYQHIRAEKTTQRLHKIIAAIALAGSATSCCSYESGTVAMLFFSRCIDRVEAVAGHFRSILGRHASARINVWPGLTNGVQPPGATATKDTLADWKRQFDAWMVEVQARAHRYPPGFVLDDGRDSIYQGCGE